MWRFSGRNVSIAISTLGSARVFIRPSEFISALRSNDAKVSATMLKTRLEFSFCCVTESDFLQMHRNLCRVQGSKWQFPIDAFNTVLSFFNDDEQSAPTILVESNLSADNFEALLRHVKVYCQSGGFKSYNGTVDPMNALLTIAEKQLNSLDTFILEERTLYSSTEMQIVFNFEKAGDRVIS